MHFSQELLLYKYITNAFFFSRICIVDIVPDGGPGKGFPKGKNRPSGIPADRKRRHKVTKKWKALPWGSLERTLKSYLDVKLPQQKNNLNIMKGAVIAQNNISIGSYLSIQDDNPPQLFLLSLKTNNYISGSQAVLRHCNK